MNDLPVLVPESVTVVFPAFGPDKPSSGFYTVHIPLVSLQIPQYRQTIGVPSPYSHVISRYEPANFSGGDSVTPTNSTALSSLATQVATDWYRWRLGELEQQYVGIVATDPGAFHDREWVQGHSSIKTRVSLKNEKREDLLVPVPVAKGSDCAIRDRTICLAGIWTYQISNDCGQNWQNVATYGPCDQIPCTGFFEPQNVWEPGPCVPVTPTQGIQYWYKSTRQKFYDNRGCLRESTTPPQLIPIGCCIVCTIDHESGQSGDDCHGDPCTYCSVPATTPCQWTLTVDCPDFDGGDTGGEFWCVTLDAGQNATCGTAGDKICFPASALGILTPPIMVGSAITWDAGGGVKCHGVVSSGPYATSEDCDAVCAGSEGGPGTGSCTGCNGVTPSSWSFTGAGFTDDFAPFNGTFELSFVGQAGTNCQWLYSGGVGSIHAGLNIVVGPSEITIELTLSTADGLHYVIYQLIIVATDIDCCIARTLTILGTPEGGAAPGTMVVTPTCGDPPPDCFPNPSGAWTLTQNATQACVWTQGKAGVTGVLTLLYDPIADIFTLQLVLTSSTYTMVFAGFAFPVDGKFDCTASRILQLVYSPDCVCSETPISLIATPVPTSPECCENATPSACCDSRSTPMPTHLNAAFSGDLISLGTIVLSKTGTSVWESPSGTYCGAFGTFGFVCSFDGTWTLYFNLGSSSVINNPTAIAPDDCGPPFHWHWDTGVTVSACSSLGGTFSVIVSE